MLNKIKRLIFKRRVSIEIRDLESSPLTLQDDNNPQPSTSSMTYGTIGPYFESLRKRLLMYNQVGWNRTIKFPWILMGIRNRQLLELTITQFHFHKNTISQYIKLFDLSLSSTKDLINYPLWCYFARLYVYIHWFSKDTQPSQFN